MAAEAIYQLYTDNTARTATLTIGTGSAPSEAEYQPASLVDDNPALVAKINSTTAAWIVDHGSATDVQIAALIHHDFDAGADVKIQRNATNSWGTPTMSVSFTIPTWQGSGATRWPVNPWLDLTSQTGYSGSGFRYTRIVITSNSQNVQMGQLWLGSTIRRFTRNMESGAQETRTRGVITNITGFGVETTYPRHNPQWGCSFSLPLLTDTLRSSLQTQWDNVGGTTYPWLFIPDGDVNACYLVKWAMTEERFARVLKASGHAGVSQADFVVQEVARGLRPGT